MKKVYEDIDFCFKEKLNFIVIGTGAELNRVKKYVSKKGQNKVCLKDYFTYIFDERKESQLLFVRPTLKVGMTYSTSSSELEDSMYKDFIRINIKTKKEMKKMSSKFKVGDKVKIITKKSKYYNHNGTIVGFGLNDILVSVLVPQSYSYITIHFRDPESLMILPIPVAKSGLSFNIGDKVYNKLLDDVGVIVDFNKDKGTNRSFPYTVNLKSNGETFCSEKNLVLIPKKEKKTEWRPKKGEMIEVSEDNKRWNLREFKVFVDGNYYVIDRDYRGRNSLVPYKYARPFHKVEPKFKVSDVVTDNRNGIGYVQGITPTDVKTGKCKYFTIFEGGRGEYNEEDLTKVNTIPIKEGTISFRGKSKGIMVNKNIVMYYSHKYNRILISEAETPLKKKYAWVECKKEDLKAGDIFKSDNIDRICIYIKPEKDWLIGYEYDSSLNHGWNSFCVGYSKTIYKAIEL